MIYLSYNTCRAGGWPGFQACAKGIARTYVSRLLAKLNARDRAQLVIIAYESGLITPGKS
ncbi:MAG TPA: hypothetical protein VGD58_17225 [Herpetosiphonaceae bacterium]